MTFSIKYHKLSDIQSDLENGKLTCVELAKHYLKNIELSKHLNAYLEVFEEEAMQKAALLDRKIEERKEKPGRLFGMFVAVKDVLCIKDRQVTGASKILEGFESTFTCTAIERLLQEDAILIGRVNCDQFAMGSTNENSVYGPVLNPCSEEHVSGGSSGGSAVAVRTDTCLAALGTDTGGSVRQPAAFCGVVGFKPGYGRISRHGLLAYASSFDQAGILAHCVEDVAIMLEIMAGPDQYDATAIQEKPEPYSSLLDFKGKTRIAYFPQALEHPGLDSEIREQMKLVIERLIEDGHEVEPVEFEYLDFMIPAYYVLTTAEASSNLARYDGIKFGRRTQSAENLSEVYSKSRTEGFSEEVKRRIMLGTFVLSSGYYDAYYTKAQKVRALIKAKTSEIFKNYQILLMPAAPGTAFRLGEKSSDPVAMYLSDIYTVQANLAGIPAISIPLENHSNGLPIGIQFMSERNNERLLLSFVDYAIRAIIKAKS